MNLSITLFNSDTLICNILLLSLCSSPHWVPARIMLLFFFFPTNSAKNRLMALSVPPTFPPTHSFASGSNKLSNYSSSSSSHCQFPNNTFGQEERLLQTCTALPTVRTKSAPPDSKKGKYTQTEACKHSSLPPLPKVNTELVCKPGWGQGTALVSCI